MSLVSISGFVALTTYILSIVPKNVATVFPATKKLKFIKMLFKHRKFIGLSTFFWSSIHATITISHMNINLLSLDTYSYYYSGITAFVIFTLLAITSNKFSVKKLKKNWKALHSLTYVAMVMLLVHIWNMMESNWTRLTGIGLCLLVSVTIMYLIRLYIDSDLKLFQSNSNNSSIRKYY